jgi:RNA polymerase sigma factor, sigma-70 family
VEIKDKELIKLIKKDPSLGLSKAIDCYGGAIKVICLSILNGYSREDVEEAVSDTFVALWKGIENFHQENNVSLKSYLYGIARRTALNKRRQLQKTSTNEEYDTEQASDFDTEEEAMQELNGMLLRALIEEMKSPDREIFVKRYFGEKMVKEIADELRVSAKFVENRLARGKEKLRKQLIENGVMV